MKRLVTIGGMSALVVLGIIFGALFAGPLMASASSQPTATTGAKGNAYCDQYLTDLANHLGISVDKLKQAQQSARSDVLAQLVKDGKLSQKRADALQKRLAKHACAGIGSRHAHKAKVAHLLAKKYLPQLAAQVAQGLHMPSEQLITQLKAGKSLKDIAATQHVSDAQLHTIVSNAIQNVLKQAVSSGNITQAMADKVMKQLQSHPQLIDRLINKHFLQHGEESGKPQAA